MTPFAAKIISNFIFLDLIVEKQVINYCNMKQAEAEVVPSSSFVEIEVEVGVEVGNEVGVKS